MVCGTDAAATVAVDAALVAFRKALWERAPAAKPAVAQRFGRDPYAFVLYLGGPHRNQQEALKILGRSPGEKVVAMVTGIKGVLVVERWFNHVARPQ